MGCISGIVPENTERLAGLVFILEVELKSSYLFIRLG